MKHWLIVFFLFLGCGFHTKECYTYECMEDEIWRTSREIVFQIKPDTKWTYKPQILIRHRIDYKANNLWIAVCLRDSAGVVKRRDTLNLDLTLPGSENWAGQGVLLKTAYFSLDSLGDFYPPGNYSIRISQLMGVSRLEGISGIGLKLYYEEKQN